MVAEFVEGDIYRIPFLTGSQIQVSLGSPHTTYLYISMDHVFLLLAIFKQRPFSIIL